VLAFGALFRGDAGWGRLATLAALTAALRFAFYSWFEPTNAEWKQLLMYFAKMRLPVERTARLLN